jgi:Cu/Ag efflux pump CusA
MLMLAGLVIALGVLVDDAVVNVDGIRRRIREEPDTPRAALAVGALRQARGPLGYATLVVLVAALPLLFLGGLPGAFARPLAWAYAAAVATSAVVALCVTPALTLALFRDGRRPGESRVVRALRARYLAVLPRHQSWGRLGALVAAAAVAASALLLPGLHGSLLPPLRDRSLLVSWTGTPSMSQPETSRITEAASAELRRVPGVTNVGVHVGRAITSDEQLGVNSSELWLTIAGNADYDATVAKVERVVAQYPGFNHHLLTYPEQKVGQVQTGAHSDLAVRVFGPDMDVLRSKAQEIQHLLSGVPGVVAPQVDTPPEQPTIEIEVNLAAAQRYGIKPGDVRRASAVLLSGLVAGSLFQDQKVFDVVVLGTLSTRDSVTSIQNLVIDTPSGGHVRVGDVADVRVRPNPAVIKHDNVSRRVDVLADVRGRDIGAVQADIRKRLAGVTFPEEFHAEILQLNSSQDVNAASTAGLVGVAAALILLLLQVAFGSWRRAALVFVALLAAPVGGILAARLDGGTMSLGSLVGLFAVWVLAARQVIAMAWQVRNAADGTDERQIAGERFAPVLKSTLATAVFVLPMVFLGHVAGLEMLRPLAVAVLGGLVTSTLLTLFLVPALLREGLPRAVERPPSEEEQLIDTLPLAKD